MFANLFATQPIEAPIVAGLLVAALVIRPLRALAREAAREADESERVVILGSGPLARKLIDEIESPRSRMRVAGVVAEPRAGDAPSPFPLMGSLDDLGAIVRRVGPDRIIVALDERRGRLPVAALLNSKLDGVIVEDGVEAYERLTGKLAIESLMPSALIFSQEFRGRRLYRTAARGLGFAAAALGLLLTAPLFALIALLIRLDSRGPVFFVQERVGKGGRRFRLIKFRTMRPEERPRSEWAGDNQHRVTRIGGVLRRLHLDELPQLVNVLRGDMNLVGPRPHPVCNFDLFTASIPYYPVRCSVRPGVTGWAQVRYGYANNLEEETEKMRYDLHYIKYRSLRLDLLILLETARAVLRGQPADALPARRAPAGARPADRAA